MIARNSSITTRLRRLPICYGVSLVYIFALVAMLVTSVPWALAGKDGEITNNIEAAASLRSLLAQVREAYPGQVLEVELERDEYDKKDIWVYEVKLLTQKGSVLKLKYNAINLELLKIKGRPEN